MNNTNCNVELTITEKGIWRRAKSGERLWRYMVQEAPTMRARCRKCSQFITKGDLKWGIPIRHSHGEYGWITAWQHLGCTRISERDGIGGVVYGFDLLNLGQQKYVLNEVTSDVIPKHLQPLDPDDLIKRESLPEAEPPSDLLRPLLRYQKEGLGWLVSQEKSPLKGGILADEMGMGKSQTKPVHVIRFITESSVEERMLNLQEKKMLVFEGTIDGKLTSLQNLTEDDLQFLFTR
uniref:Putative DNA repair protein n=1 Tax=Trypanosoma vivax (strain Y486) TaxID=1055687 RepID=G0U9U4_TRYVY|nr:putative DNA repair protein, fragment [Trypanosoma vivax Y486]